MKVTPVVALLLALGVCACNKPDTSVSAKKESTPMPGARASKKEAPAIPNTEALNRQIDKESKTPSTH